MPDMSTAEELRLIADSLQLMLPFQAARLHVLASRVDELDKANAVRRGKASACASDRRGDRPTTS